jgi:hypothetical protein
MTGIRQKPKASGVIDYEDFGKWLKGFNEFKGQHFVSIIFL